MKKIIITVLLILLYIPAFVTAQNYVPNIPIEDSLDNEYVLPNVLHSGKNYLVEISVNWCIWCKVELKEWKECSQEWEDNYNLKVFVLSADGTDSEDKQNMLNWFSDEEFEYDLYFANNDSVLNYLSILAYPTNFLVNEEGIIVDTIYGYQDCDDMSQKISDNFDMINSNNIVKKNSSEIIIVDLKEGLIVTHGEMQEEIHLIFYSIDGSLISEIKNKWTNEIIEIPEINGLAVVKVIGKNWVQSKIIKGK